MIESDLKLAEIFRVSMNLMLANLRKEPDLQEPIEERKPETDVRKISLLIGCFATKIFLKNLVFGFCIF